MKLSLNTDFTQFPRVNRLIRVADLGPEPLRPIPFDVAVLTSEERHLRRRALTLAHGGRVLVDFPEPVVLGDREILELEDGRRVEIIAAEEALYEVRGRDIQHLVELAWHIGNRHLAAQIEADRVLIPRDAILRAMLERLGAEIAEVQEPFQPTRGAYAGSGAVHSHAQPERHDPHPHSHG